MSEEELTKIANTFLQKNYGMNLQIPIKRNNRLRTTLGRYVISHNKQPLRIEIAGNTLTYGTKAAIIGIVKHECIHYALHSQGLAYKDRHPLFEEELRKHEAPSTNTQIIGKYFVFRCNECQADGRSKFKRLVLHPQKYRTTCCNAQLTIIGEQIYNGEVFHSHEMK